MDTQRHEIIVKYGGRLDTIRGLCDIIKLYDGDEGIWSYTVGDKVYQSREFPPLEDDHDTRSKIHKVIRNFIKSSPATLEFKVEIEVSGSKKRVQIVE
mgnify:CR=1 FL=1